MNEINPKKTFTDGVARGFLLHLFQILLMPALLYPSGFGFQFWSVTQLVYTVPAIVLALRAGEREMAKGLATLAGIGFLLNGICDVALRTL